MSMIIWLCLEILILKIGTLYVNSLKICHNLTESFHWVIFPWPWQAVKVVRIWKSWKQVSLLWDCVHFAEEIWGHLQLGIQLHCSWPWPWQCTSRKDFCVCHAVCFFNLIKLQFQITVFEIPNWCPFGPFNKVSP